MINPNWNRWIWASVSTYFKNTLTQYPLYIEGDDRNTNENSDLFEFRMDGPFIIELNKNYWELDVEISIMVTSIRDEQDVHKIHRMTGIAAAAFIEDIPVYRYGNNIQDDQSFLGCLQLRAEGKERIANSQFGQIDPTVRVMQASVDAFYRVRLDT